MAAAAVQLDGSVLIWYVIEWFNGLLKNENKIKTAPTLCVGCAHPMSLCVGCAGLRPLVLH
jgi:hypothetical protein